MVDESLVLDIVETAARTGKLKRGTNETTKALERGTAVLVVYADDVQPKEIVLHLPLLGREKGIPVVSVKSKADLGAAAGLEVATASIAILDAGEAKAQLNQLVESLKEEAGKGE